MAQASDTAYETIRDGISNGTFARGERLREESLATLAGVSRTPVREALRQLHTEGFVDLLPNRGARVAAWSREELLDLYDTRALLEGYGAQLAAQRITSTQLEELSVIAKEMTAIENYQRTDLEDLTALNNKFHQLVATAARNRYVKLIVPRMIDVPLVHQTFERYPTDQLAVSMQAHEQLVRALRAGDPDWAKAVMRAHILAARTTVLSTVDDEQPN